MSSLRGADILVLRRDLATGRERLVGGSDVPLYDSMDDEMAYEVFRHCPKVGVVTHEQRL
jgi:hypothetical protein